MRDVELFPDQAAQLAETFGLLADPTRLSIVMVCMEREVAAVEDAEVDEADEHQDAVHHIPAGAEVAVVAIQQVVRYHLRRWSVVRMDLRCRLRYWYFARTGII